GRWLYAMVSPENATPTRFSLAEFVEILPKSSFTTKNSFSDENGEPLDTGFTFSLTKNTFTAGTEKTTVQIAKKMSSLAELEQFVAMGYKEGMAVVMRNLDEYLLSLVAGK
ncbi:MAG: SRPBCC domain-containing protein, partial [Saprospiraceae bacterium]|nr:SRPBCC domain-containing protein [Saprospiraceae bacterium]